MGKPFKSEIELIHSTAKWAEGLKLDNLKSYLNKTQSPIYIVGSGGSYSACLLAVSLFSANGKFAKAVTPLELFHLKETIKDASIIFLSASGRNYDIKFAFKIAIEQDPRQISIVTMKSESPLSILAKKYRICNLFNFDLPSGKDGFLATNSLLAFYILLNNSLSQNKFIFKNISKKKLFEINNFLNKTKIDFVYQVLYSGWNKSIAYDLESKCSEAALAPVLISDYRNFGHGRHHWFDKQKTTAIIALCNEDDFILCKKTLDLLPKTIPTLVLRSNFNYALGSIDLLVQSFSFINALGEKVGIDPGRPGVPYYGRKLYNLAYSNTLSKKEKNKLTKRASISIKRKLKTNNFSLIDSKLLKLWINSYNTFVENLKKATFGAIIFDYDGTICSSEERYTGPSKEIIDKIIDVLDSGYLIGIATGRGKSVRETLQKQLPERFWKNVIIGYYNGSDCGFLNNNRLPNKKKVTNKSLSKIHTTLKTLTDLYKINLELRPNQITVETSDIRRWSFVRDLIIQRIKTNSIDDIQILDSSHSMDIIPISVSKLNTVSFVKDHLRKNSLPEDVLTIGDKGQWPGNDFMLLESKYSLSVDEVSTKLNCCWNLSSLGFRNVSATIEYLNFLVFKKDGIKIKINK